MTPWSCLRFSESRMKTTCIKRPLSIFFWKNIVLDMWMMASVSTERIWIWLIMISWGSWCLFLIVCGSALLVGNKKDLTQRRVVKEDEGEEMAKKLGMSFCECSAVSHSEWGNMGLTVWLAFGDGLKKKYKYKEEDTSFYQCGFHLVFYSKLFRHIHHESRQVSVMYSHHKKRAIETIIWWHWAQSNRDIRWWRGAA